MDPDVEAQLVSTGLKIEILGDPAAAKAFDRIWGGTGYIFYVGVTCEMPGPVFVHDLVLKLPWDDSIDWADEFSQVMPRHQVCKFEGMFPKAIGLNNLTLYSNPLRRGRYLEGFLVGIGGHECRISIRTAPAFEQSSLLSIDLSNPIPRN